MKKVSKTKKADVEGPKPKHSLICVYSGEYNISAGGLEKLHPFDSKKFGRVFALLEKSGVVKGPVFQPVLVTEEQLLKVHEAAYLERLSTKSSEVARVTEVPMLFAIPAFLLRKLVLRPMQYQTGGTILACSLALEHGYCFNLGGGFHHAKSASGEGFCAYADVPIAITLLQEKQPDLRVLIVDLDAHQGNGNAMCLGTNPNVAIFDMFNGAIYPNDRAATRFVDYCFPLPHGTCGESYLDLLKVELPIAFSRFQPNLCVFNAGTDVLSGDPLGGLGLSKDQIQARDLFVFRQCRDHACPIAMVLSGGYTRMSATVIAESIEVLSRDGVLSDLSRFVGKEEEERSATS